MGVAVAPIENCDFRTSSAMPSRSIFAVRIRCTSSMHITPTVIFRPNKVKCPSCFENVERRSTGSCKLFRPMDGGRVKKYSVSDLTAWEVIGQLVSFVSSKQSMRQQKMETHAVRRKDDPGCVLCLFPELLEAFSILLCTCPIVRQDSV